MQKYNIIGSQFNNNDFNSILLLLIIIFHFFTEWWSTEKNKLERWHNVKINSMTYFKLLIWLIFATITGGKCFLIWNDLETDAKKKFTGQKLGYSYVCETKQTQNQFWAVCLSHREGKT